VHPEPTAGFYSFSGYHPRRPWRILGTLEGGLVMVILRESEKQLLDMLKARLARVERGEMWGLDHPGPYTAEETAREIARLNARIAELWRKAHT